MKFEETFDFDHDVDVLLRMFTNETYYMDKYEQLAGRRPELVGSDKTDNEFSITVRHALDATKLSFPDMLKKRMGDRIFLRQTDRWVVDQSAGRIEIDIEKAPVDIAIDLRLAENGPGKSRLTLLFDIDAKVPLLGSKIEKAIAGPITQRTRKDLALSNEIAANYAG